MAEVPSTHYVKSDDVYIAYQVLGEGPLDLMFVPGFVSNVEAIWQSPNRSRFLRRLASFCRVIIFDKRGTGMSDRGSQIFTLEQRMHDVQAILNEVGSDRAALFGISEGGPMSLLYAATYPERTSARSFCTALTPSVPGRPIMRSAGRMRSGTMCLTTSNTTGAPRKE